MDTIIPGIQHLLDISGDFIMVTDVTGSILYQSTMPERYRSYFRKLPAIGDLFPEVVSAERQSIVQMILHDVCENRHAFKTETDFTDDAGNMVFLAVTFQPRIEEDAMCHVYILIQDITQQKIFERKLSAQAKSISNLIELAHAIIIGVDTRGYITDWNTHSARLTGYTKNEAYTRKFKDLLLIDTYKHVFDEQLEQCIVGKTEQNFEVMIKCKSGLLLTVLVNITPRINTSGNVIGSVVVGHDVTELTQYRKTLEEKMQERNRELMQALKNEREMLDLKKRFSILASDELYEPLLRLQTDVELAAQQAAHLPADEMTARLKHIEKCISQLILFADKVFKYTHTRS